MHTKHPVSRKIRHGHNRELPRRPPLEIPAALNHCHPQSLHHLRRPHPRLPHDHPGLPRDGPRCDRGGLHRVALLQRGCHRGVSVQRPGHRAQLLGDDFRHGKHTIVLRRMALDQNRGDSHQRGADFRPVAVRFLDFGRNVRHWSDGVFTFGHWRVAKVEFGGGGSECEGQGDAAVEEKRKGGFGMIVVLLFVYIVIFLNKFLVKCGFIAIF